MFGSACRDLLGQLDMPQAEVEAGAVGEGGGKSGKSLSHRDLDAITPADFPFLVVINTTPLAPLEP